MQVAIREAYQGRAGVGPVMPPGPRPLFGLLEQALSLTAEYGRGKVGALRSHRPFGAEVKLASDSTARTRVRTANPAPPFGVEPPPDSSKAGPAISR